MTTPPADPTRRPAVRLGVGWWVWAVLVLLGLAVCARVGVFPGGMLIAAGCVVAAVWRSFRPDASAGGLHIRSRRVDVAFMLLAALAVAVATFLVHAREGI